MTARISLGLRYMVASTFFFSLMSLGVALAGRRLPATIMVLARGVIGLVMSYAILRRRRISPWAQSKGLLVLRGLFGFGGLMCFFWSLTRLPMAEATVIQYLNPLFVALLAGPLLGEQVGRVLLASILICLAGVILVTRPSFLFGGQPLDPTAVAVAVLGAASASGAYVTIRKIGPSVDPVAIVFAFPALAVPLTLPFVIPDWVWPTPVEWLLLLGLGVATQIAQVYMTKGLQLETAGRATAISYTQILFATVWGILFLGQIPHVGTIAGTVLIVIGCLLVTLRTPRESAIKPDS